MEKIVVIGLGYVGLPLAAALGRKNADVVGFDIDPARVKALAAGHDWTDEVSDADLASTKLRLTHEAAALDDRTFFIVTVPTPIDDARRPELGPVLGACTTIGQALKRRGKTDGAKPLIIFESTVYPGLTEEICGPKIAEISGLVAGKDFTLGYSPERINPGDKQHRLESITKVVAAQNAADLARMEAVYGPIIDAGLHKAPSIRVAEAAKVLENTQRDLNIALMNELAMICDRMDIRTTDVLAAAGTKWNFLKFTPGLVGGHCIGVDPYYLTAKAETLGYHPQVILAGRRINDSMPYFIAQKLVKLMSECKIALPKARIGVLGLAFKENVRDLRNSRVPEIVQELSKFGCEILVHDPLTDAAQAKHEYNIELAAPEKLQDLDVLILAVPHKILLDQMRDWMKRVKPQGIFVDIKSALDPASVPQALRYWSL